LKYNGKDLNCNNFREVLKDFSVDIQDVVRSALMDGVDIGDYIAKSNPYKLDQIRLAMKENLSSQLFNMSGELLYQVRMLKKKGVNLSHFSKVLSVSLSDEHTSYVLNWVKDGVDFSKVRVELIPKRLLEVFDKGLRSGVDMTKFLSMGSSLPARYLELCVQIEKAGKDCEFLLKNSYNLSVVECFYNNLDLSEDCWKAIKNNVNTNDESERIKLLILMAKNGIDISKLQQKQGESYKYSTDCLKILVEGYKAKVDINLLLKATTPQEMEDVIYEAELNSGRKISGRFMKKSH